MTEKEIHEQIYIAITDACENSSLSYYSRDDVANEVSNCYEYIRELLIHNSLLEKNN